MPQKRETSTVLASLVDLSCNNNEGAEMGMTWPKLSVNFPIRNMGTNLLSASVQKIAFPQNTEVVQGAAVQQECIHPFTLSFENLRLEEQYREFQLDIARQQLFGRWGQLSITSMITLVIVIGAYIQAALSHHDFSVASLPYMLVGVPLLAFCFIHQWTLHRGDLVQDQIQARSWVIKWVLLVFVTEAALAHIYDSHPHSEGCEVNRLRCPYSFCSTKFTSRAIVAAALVIFHITPCMSFHEVVILVMLLGLATRAPQLMWIAPSRGDLGTNLWSLICMAMQFSIFLTCRCRREINERQKFLLQLHISRLRAHLQDMLDNMMPRCLSERAQAGECIIDAYEHGTVLFCSFPKGALPKIDDMQSFLLLDRVYALFDELVSESKSFAFKVEHVGNDYMVVSPVFLMPKDLKGWDTDQFRQQGCVSLALLAQKMLRRGNQILKGSGIELRVGLASGPLYAAVIGQSRKHLRILGEAVNSATAMCHMAAPWHVNCSGWSAAVLRDKGLLLSSLGEREIKGKGPTAVYAMDAGVIQPDISRTAFARPTKLSRAIRSGANISSLFGESSLTDSEASVQAASTQVTEAMELISPWTGAFFNPDDERRYQHSRAAGGGEEGDAAAEGDEGAEGGDELMDAEAGEADGALMKGLVLVACQAVFFAGLPAPLHLEESCRVTVAAQTHAVMAATLAVSAAAAVWPRQKEGSGTGGGARRWRVVQATVVVGLCALALIEPEPFLLLGFVTAVTSSFIARPTESVAASQAWLLAALAAFALAFQAGSARRGIAMANFVTLFPAAALVYAYTVWLRNENLGRRVHWLLLERRQLQWSSLWGVLGDLLPEYVLHQLYQGIPVKPHKKQAIVLYADLVGYASLWSAAPGSSGSACGGGGREVVEALHELFSRFDQEVAGLPLLYKMDSISGAYVVVGVGPAYETRLTGTCVTQLLSLSLRLQEVLSDLARDTDAPEPDAHAPDSGRSSTKGAGTGGGGRARAWARLGRLQLRIGVAEGTVVAGVMGSMQHCYQFFGGALMDAENLQRQALGGQVRVQRKVAKAAAGGFLFSPAGPGPALGDPAADAWREAVILRGRRPFIQGHWGSMPPPPPDALKPAPQPPAPVFRVAPMVPLSCRSG